MAIDPDAGLTPYERTRRALHRSIDHIVRAWPLALADADARGYPTAVMQPYGGGRDSTSVEAAALTPSAAVSWLADLHDTQILLFRSEAGSYTVAVPATFQFLAHPYVEQLLGRWQPWTERAIQQIIRLANQAQLWWPPTPPAGVVVAGTTVGQRGNDTETCKHCDQPVTGGHADPIRRIDGDAYHKSPCWYAATTGRHLVRIQPRHHTA